jgi:hypothetical protein
MDNKQNKTKVEQEKLPGRRLNPTPTPEDKIEEVAGSPLLELFRKA